MRLFQFSYSPFAAKVRKCLELKGLTFETVEVPYLDRRALVAVTGGSVQIPVLEDGGTVVSDSAAITAYLDGRYPPSLRVDPLAIVLEGWADHVLEDVAFRLASPGLEAGFAAAQGGREDARAMFRVVKERKFGPGCLDAWRTQRGALADRVVDLLEPIARAVATRPWILGDTPSVADAAVYGQLHMVQAAIPGFVAERVPALASWFARVRDAGRRA
ncbi:glutathione S-transferase family protein [Anaeromyxobacter oryzae]|uniref:Glutathione S-transferase n=1 Tax=Anaeromyxobacter oryzae TaxID=2918170 RepID=A0ABN6MS24_9BACT|nr:glutathione S-transferase family protein [Anaeromyxobacter oryzae]BDG03756.1 glutathione S-transferase [Anaeromyxobacter oryzae]